ncbi:hypothetical protein GN958_ATG15700 [Phytophthora infestans]|uniref:Uncharacterized protein n=1 Tax=Phytophthora infestans TaxID=4787 RepID=A0A8S9U3F5_PHYIN|nr:hypothetical protein GN958_ATG15700 [Phytophthora infestans]
MGRACTKGTGRKPKRYTRVAVDYTHKLELLKYLAGGHDVGDAIAHFYPGCPGSAKTRKQKQISKWKK